MAGACLRVVVVDPGVVVVVVRRPLGVVLGPFSCSSRWGVGSVRGFFFFANIPPLPFQRWIRIPPSSS